MLKASRVHDTSMLIHVPFVLVCTMCRPPRVYWHLVTEEKAHGAGRTDEEQIIEMYQYVAMICRGDTDLISGYDFLFTDLYHYDKS